MGITASVACIDEMQDKYQANLYRDGKIFATIDFAYTSGTVVNVVVTVHNEAYLYNAMSVFNHWPVVEAQIVEMFS